MLTLSCLLKIHKKYNYDAVKIHVKSNQVSKTNSCSNGRNSGLHTLQISCTKTFLFACRSIKILKMRVQTK